MMRIKIILFCFIVVSTFSLNAQSLPNDKDWDPLLNDVKIKYIYSLKYDALVPRPMFGKELRALNGQTITINGFFMPLDLTGNIYVLSYNPMSMCFFCTGGGLETVIELNVLPEHLEDFKRLKTDDFFEVKGKLRLNKDIFEHLFYILDEVEFVKLID